MSYVYQDEERDATILFMDIHAFYLQVCILN